MKHWNELMPDFGDALHCCASRLSYLPIVPLSRSLTDQEPIKQDRKISMFLKQHNICSLPGDLPSGLQLRGTQNILASLKEKVGFSSWSIGSMFVNTSYFIIPRYLPYHAAETWLQTEPHSVATGPPRYSNIANIFIFTSTFFNPPLHTHLIHNIYHQH